MGRKRKDLKFHKVKGYYSTYPVGGKTRYKYFGTHDPEVAYHAHLNWRPRLRKAEATGMTLDQMSKRENMARRKQWARFILSLPDDNDQTQDVLLPRYKRWLNGKKRPKPG